VLGLTKTASAGTDVALAEAHPGPPDVGLNVFTFEVAADAMVVRPWMPNHGHGSVPAEFATTPGPNETWTTPKMDFFMPGLWEVTAEFTTGNVVDEVVFRFCLEG
jgi:hypothetical protein